jgi:hypothetical protein
MTTPSTLGQAPCPIGVAGDGESAVKLRRDDRKSSRTAVPRERQACELKYGPEVLSGLLADRSARGFGVFVDQIDHLTVGKKVKLHTDQGTFKVRIVYINRVAGPEYTESKTGVWYRLGLKIASKFFFL